MSSPSLPTPVPGSKPAPTPVKTPPTPTSPTMAPTRVMGKSKDAETSSVASSASRTIRRAFSGFKFSSNSAAAESSKRLSLNSPVSVAPTTSFDSDFLVEPTSSMSFEVHNANTNPKSYNSKSLNSKLFNSKSKKSKTWQTQAETSPPKIPPPPSIPELVFNPTWYSALLNVSEVEGEGEGDAGVDNGNGNGKEVTKAGTAVLPPAPPTLQPERTNPSSVAASNNTKAAPHLPSHNNPFVLPPILDNFQGFSIGVDTQQTTSNNNNGNL